MFIFSISNRDALNIIILLDIVASILFQLLSITTPGGSSGVEDQTDLLGFTAERSKSIKHILITCDIHLTTAIFK